MIAFSDARRFFDRKVPAAADPVSAFLQDAHGQVAAGFSGGKNFSIEETTCVAKGDDVCTILIGKRPLD